MTTERQTLLMPEIRIKQPPIIMNQYIGSLRGVISLFF